MLGIPQLNAALQVRSHKSRVERENHLPQTAGQSSFSAGQAIIGFLGCRCTLLAHVELLVNHAASLLFVYFS